MVKGDLAGSGRTGMETQLPHSRAYGTPDTSALIYAEDVREPWKDGDTDSSAASPKSGPQGKSPLNSCGPASNFCPQYTSKISPTVFPKGNITVAPGGRLRILPRAGILLQREAWEWLGKSKAKVSFN